MKKIIALILAVAMMATMAVVFTSCAKDEEIIVQTNAFFAPFEYYEGENIVGVDVEIMNLVGEKMGKKVTFKNVEFSAIIDNVKGGEVCDAGAAGITVTPEREENMSISIPYMQNKQVKVIKK